MNSLTAMKTALMQDVPSEGVKSLLVALAQDVRPKNGPDVWPGIDTLAKRMGVHRRTAIRRKAAAAEAGLIKVERRPRGEGSGRTSGRIRLLFLGDNRYLLETPDFKVTRSRDSG